MNFQENYKKEMDLIKHNKAIDQRILSSSGQPEQPSQAAPKKSTFRNWKGFAAAFALLCMLVTAACLRLTDSRADTFSDSFVVMAGNEDTSYEKAVLPGIVLFDFDKESFLSDRETVQESDDVYSHDYKTAAEFTAATNIHLPESDALTFGTVSFSLDAKERTGILSIETMYDGSTYALYAKFAIDGFASDYLGVVVNGDISETYEYAAGKNACFINFRADNAFSSVYFSEDGFLFTMDYETPEEKETMKEIIDSIAK